MQVIPVQAVPNQTFSILLANQSCQIAIYQKSTGLFFDLTVNNVPILIGEICQNLNTLVKAAYLGFVGNFWFADTQGSSDPVYTGLGSRFILEYIEASDLASRTFAVPQV
jgi:hypothetical protein